MARRSSTLHLRELARQERVEQKRLARDRKRQAKRACERSHHAGDAFADALPGCAGQGTAIARQSEGGHGH
jgi:hypothetical protein